jgi:glycosyltransferase involved in cell wall biosynthesis
MTVLHVACLPFPTYQGTQAAVAAMLETSSRLGLAPHLLAYAHGAGAFAEEPPYEVHRLRDCPRVRSLRSGPSWKKIALDVQCIVETRRSYRRLAPDAVVAHHTEAALATLAAGVAPIYYVAHTTLEEELPVFFPRLVAPWVATVARRVETALHRHAAGIGAVSPALVERIGPKAFYLPVPWAPTKGPPSTTTDAREALGLGVDGPVGLYAGNLDAYQGWEDLIFALAALQRTFPKARLLLATESDPMPARRLVRRAGLEHSVHFRRLGGEQQRRLVHAASDFAWVPRRTPGGAPIKMLDSLARGLPVVATQRAASGLPVDEACVLVENDAPLALAHAAERVLADPALGGRLRAAGLEYLRRHHDERAFERALGRFLGWPARRSRVLDERPRSSAEARRAGSSLR